MKRVLAMVSSLGFVAAGALFGTAAPAQADDIRLPEGIYTYIEEGTPVGVWTIWPVCTPTVGDLRNNMELPVACLVHSGKKSLHAIVRIDAADYAEYRKRVDYLYAVCKKNGLEIDTQNRNPSRLSRMPGVMRQGHKQFLVDTNIGKASFVECVGDVMVSREGRVLLQQLGWCQLFWQ